MNDAEYDWIDVARHLDETVERVVSEIRREHPRLSTKTGYSKNESFSFRYFASFSRTGTPHDEDAVFSVDVKRTPEGLICEADIAHGEGAVWAEAPPFSQPATTEPIEPTLRKWLEGLDAFLVENAQLLSERLSQAGDAR